MRKPKPPLKISAPKCRWCQDRGCLYCPPEAAEARAVDPFDKVTSDRLFLAERMTRRAVIKTQRLWAEVILEQNLCPPLCGERTGDLVCIRMRGHEGRHADVQCEWPV